MCSLSTPWGYRAIFRRAGGGTTLDQYNVRTAPFVTLTWHAWLGSQPFLHDESEHSAFLSYSHSIGAVLYDAGTTRARCENRPYGEAVRLQMHATRRGSAPLEACTSCCQLANECDGRAIIGTDAASVMLRARLP